MKDLLNLLDHAKRNQWNHSISHDFGAIVVWVHVYDEIWLVTFTDSKVTFTKCNLYEAQTWNDADAVKQIENSIWQFECQD